MGGILALLAALIVGTFFPMAHGSSCDAAAAAPGIYDAMCLAETDDSSKILIRGGTVVNADRQFHADVYIEDGIIKLVAPDLKVLDGVRVVDATGKYVMPGGIDPHTHLAMPFMGQETCDDFFSGQAAALAGGTTMHIDFALPIDGDLLKGFESYRRKAEPSCMDYGFHMAVTTWNDKVAQDMETLVKEHGINSFKFFMAYKGSLMVTDEQLLQGFKTCKSLGALPQVHAENGDAVAEGQSRIYDLGITGPEGHALSRPSLLEGEATARAIRLAKFVNTPLYVVHVMSIDALEEIARARQAGQRVIGEPVASGLVLDDSKLWDPDFRVAAQYVMSPPIRPAGHNAALQAALSSGVLQLVGTDHCPFNSSQKAAGRGDFRKIPNGVNGIEERMHIVWDAMVNSGKISPSDYVRISSTACAQIFNVYPRKGAVLPGSDADLIILNPNKTTTISAKAHHSNIDTNIYEGWQIKGNIEVTISQGRIVWENERLNVARGAGRYVKMAPFGQLFDGIVKADIAYLSSLKAPVYRK
ncbi:dihydropyrimidinase [Selaginella moellendorffii]|uniref:dihydropyrimidinase n=1 Tax=Selaginella moellendorffii TaxID=88036 RepID=UPI000D1CF96D|nr:dihydropyrimidinase [Selaginella moellendorffii]|eukprot:XP_024545302.1 dihydropyrimidinase [Selaginella moellendorffii]